MMNVVMLGPVPLLCRNTEFTQILRRMGHKAVAQRGLAFLADALRVGAEGIGAGNQNLLPHANEQVGVGGQKRVDQVKVLHHHPFTPAHRLHNGVRQGVGLGKAHLKTDIHMVGVGGEKEKNRDMRARFFLCKVFIW